ncbi:hypothetical protein PoB_000870400 [Plakobranchus ocellatus]|uniref:Uncharacterized protein n=1 Tax=Plakobranchus ocellatus TaxID=259542 RepID=A0AAV3YGR4_9GAST|nr:hypothetical protein PoB_000870400 [Plakobranchus ocellatus]
MFQVQGSEKRGIGEARISSPALKSFCREFEYGHPSGASSRIFLRIVVVFGNHKLMAVETDIVWLRLGSSKHDKMSLPITNHEDRVGFEPASKSHAERG